MQFEVYPNPVPRARRAFPFVAVLQHPLADTGRDRVVAFLAPKAEFPRVTGRLLPVVDVGGESFLLLVPSLTNLPVSGLRDGRGSLMPYRDRIIQALDWLFIGV